MEVVYTSYSLRAGEAITESVVHKSTELAVKRIDWDGKSMAIAMSHFFTVLFISLLHF